MPPPRILRSLTAAATLVLAGAGTVALHEQRAVDDIARRCNACAAPGAELAATRSRRAAAERRYAALRERYEARVDRAREDEARLLALYERTRGRAAAPAAAPASASRRT